MPENHCDYCGRRFDRPSPCCDEGGPHPAPDLAQRVVDAIERDISDRRGLRQQWEKIDNDTQDDIRDEWARIIREELDHA